MKSNEETPGTHTRNRFTTEEDEQLRHLVKSYGQNEWDLIADQMTGRSRRQCRERWRTYLSPTITTGPWNEAELHLLSEKVTELGPRWKSLECFFPGRTDINIRNCYRQLQKNPIPPPPPALPGREPAPPPLPTNQPHCPWFADVIAALARESEEGHAQDTTGSFSSDILF
jgi:hypothetical protein